ncbi:MAG TPA: hypothetical protein VJH75_04070 [Patescibacteria group bacterium]|nr:hypothetical protein [Patescibacteria group bacterium]
MTITKPKFTQNSIAQILPYIVVLAFFVHLLNPALAEGKTGEKLVFVTQKSEKELITDILAKELVWKDGRIAFFANDSEKKRIRQPNKVINAVITAYTSTPDQTDDDPFIAATGKRVHDGMIAANGLPFGTIIKIPALYGEKEFVVEDRMNARYGFGRMDVWLDTSKAEARKFGVKRLQVEIYYPETKLSRAGR